MTPPEKNPILLGAHMSIAGGVPTAVERGMRIGCTTMQMFVKNNNQWKGKPLTDEDVSTYKKLLRESRIHPVVVHDTYLINLCAVDKEILQKSRDALKDELDRCETLGVQYLNFHPGAHLGAGEEEGIKRIAESLNLIHQRTKGYGVRSVIEATAGQGTAIGYRFEHLRKIIDLVEERERMAVCIDTCHVFAAGYISLLNGGMKKRSENLTRLLDLTGLLPFMSMIRSASSVHALTGMSISGRGRLGQRDFRS